MNVHTVYVIQMKLLPRGKKNTRQSKKGHQWEQKPLKKMQDGISIAPLYMGALVDVGLCAAQTPEVPAFQSPLSSPTEQECPSQLSGSCLLPRSRPSLLSAIDIIAHVLRMRHWGHKES